MAEKKKKLNKGLDAIFGGDITSLIDDIIHLKVVKKKSN